MAVTVSVFTYVDAHASEQNIEILGGAGGQLEGEVLGTGGTNSDPNAQNANQLPGKAHDVAVDSLGNRYAVGSQKGMNGYALYKWAANSPAWRKISGEAVRIAARPNQAWIINAKGQVFFESGPVWRNLPAPVAKEIGAGRDAVWITTKNDEIYRYVSVNSSEFHFNPDLQNNLVFNNGDGGWIRVNGSALKVELDDADNPWIIDKMGQIKRFRSGQWQTINTPRAIDLDASALGVVQFVDEAGNVLEYDVSGGRWGYLSQTNDTVAIGGGKGELLKLNKNLDIFKVR